MTAYNRKQLGYSLTALAGAWLLLMAAAPVAAADSISPTATIQTSETTAESSSPRLPRWLRQLLRVSPANAAATTNASRFVGQSIAGNLKPGETRRVSVTMRNTGTSTWARAVVTNSVRKIHKTIDYGPGVHASTCHPSIMFGQGR